ncbi:MAG: hypothetical protein M1827_007679 [Pycnora praestabilis]|nr:MAG: hypothetical protein M1827_007679 [Pycnora praestabilis]
MRLQRIRDGTLGRPPGAPAPVPSSNAAKKRKAEDEEGEGRKRSKAVEPVNGVPTDVSNESVDSADADGSLSPVVPQELKKGLIDREVTDSSQRPEDMNNEPDPPPVSSGLLAGVYKPPKMDATPLANTAVDEDEWAAFERDIATPPPGAYSGPTALNALATISAAPLSAAELAARSTAEASLQGRGRREAELEGEKEDAARQLEEEFDEMEGLEQRVRRLKEKREELRKKREVESAKLMEVDGVNEGKHKPGITGSEDEDDDDGIDEEEEEEEEEEEGWNAWR